MSEASSPQRKRPPCDAEAKLVDYLARRDHSEKELREKLRRHFSPEDTEAALRKAHERRWIPDPVELSERVVLRLNEKGKGHHYIRQYLRQKGLPPVDKDAEIEYKKARNWVALKWPEPPQSTAEGCENLEENWKEKAMRSLQRRGFDADTIRRVIYEKQ